MNKLKINLLGTGVVIKRILLPESVLEEWKGFINPKSSLTKALVDPFFYYKLKDKRYNCLEDLPSEHCSGIINAPKSQIEFWFNRKKVSKINTAELFNENLLFPLFHLEKTSTSFVSKNGIYILQNEIGTIGTYELMVNSEQLTIDDFLFETDSLQHTTFIKSISYQNQNLAFVKKDTMITYQIGFEV